MTDHDIVEPRENSAGLNIYLHAEFVRDSTVDIDVGEQYAVHTLPGGGLALVPFDRLRDYPFVVDGPPPGLQRRVSALAPAADPDPDAADPAGTEAAAPPDEDDAATALDDYAHAQPDDQHQHQNQHSQTQTHD